MKQTIQKTITLLLLYSFFLVPVVHAQEIPEAPVDTPTVEVAPAASETPTETVIELVAETPAEEPVSVQDTVEAVQEAAAAQETVVSEVIEATVNPESIDTNESSGTELLTSEPVVPTLLEPGLGEDPASPSEVPLEGDTSPLEVVLEDIPLPDVSEETAAAPVLSNDVIDTPLAALVAEPTYAFEVTGKQIPTTRTIKNNEGVIVGEETVTGTLVPQVDNAKGEVYVSGQCSDAYYVVLLFKNSTDYLDDPRSYIFNSAYPCVGGTFSYAISTLPNNLPNGTYYILVGQQGRKGAWTPITSLTEITINKTH